jgi:hypothetical protein
VPSFILAMRLSGSVGETQSWLGPFLPWRWRSRRRQVLVAGVVQPVRGSQLARQGLPVGAAVAADDGLHGGVGLQEGRIDARRLAVQQAVSVGQLQHPGEDLFVDHLGQTLADLGQAGVLGSRLGGQVAQEVAPRAAIATAPGDAALPVEALEVAAEEHAEGGIPGRPKPSA